MTALKSAAQDTAILIVDDEETLMRALCSTLEGQGYATTGFTLASEALAKLRSQRFDVLLTDLNMAEMDGIALLRAALEIDPQMVGVMITGHASINSAVEAMKAG